MLKKIKIYFLFLLVIINVMIFYVVYSESRNNLLKVSFLDVGQGDAIFIEAPNGNQLLIDGGPDKNILNALSRVMPFYDKTIDMILITHPDQDHIGGIPEVLKKYNISEYVDSGATSSTGTFLELQNEILENNIKTEIVKEGDLIDLGSGVYLKILYPNGETDSKDTNENSIVAKLFYGNSTFLLTGDAPSDVELYLAMTSGEELESNVLKVAHHGSKNSLSSEFLSAIKPEYSIISAGKNNSFGHPHKEIIDALNELGTKILGTYELGDIIFESDGDSLYVK